MSQCPVCSTPIENSFGLVECPGCNKILFADFNGKLAVHNEEEASADLSSVEEEPSADETWDSAQPESEPFVIEDPVVEPEAESILETAPTEAEPHSEVMAEINDFANSDESNLKDGQWLYTLTIDSIDTEDLREEVIEYLRDPKLAIPHELLNFELPTLVLKDLNAVKASVIVSRVKHLPVGLSWEQRSLVQDSGGAE